MPLQANSERCLVLRQQYALKMLSLLTKGKRIINFDESWVSETNYSRRMWCPSKTAGSVTERTINPRLALLAALDTEGWVYFALTHANTDSEVILTFFGHLVRQLDSEKKDWRESTVILLDGAKYHTSEETRWYLMMLQVPVIFSGPYSYTTAPIELLFGGLKTGEL